MLWLLVLLIPLILLILYLRPVPGWSNGDWSLVCQESLEYYPWCYTSWQHCKQQPVSGEWWTENDMMSPWGDVIKHTDLRDPLGDQRDPLGDQRDPLGDQRDPLGDQRDPLGDQRDPLGDQRVLFVGQQDLLVQGGQVWGRNNLQQFVKVQTVTPLPNTLAMTLARTLVAVTTTHLCVWEKDWQTVELPVALSAPVRLHATRKWILITAPHLNRFRGWVGLYPGPDCFRGWRGRYQLLKEWWGEPGHRLGAFAALSERAAVWTEPTTRRVWHVRLGNRWRPCCRSEILRGQWGYGGQVHLQGNRCCLYDEGGRFEYIMKCMK
jgi:hypothetical protein